MKKVSKYASVVLCMATLLFVSCEKAADDEDVSGASGETVSVSLSLGGEYIVATESPLTRASDPDVAYGLNVFARKDGTTTYSKYAYGLFDDASKIQITLRKGYQYRFECTVTRNDEDQVYHASGLYSAPFLNSDGELTQQTQLDNQFHYSSVTSLSGLQSGVTNITESSVANYPRMYRYYGKLEDYSPVADAAVNISLKRAVFGLRFVVTPPSEGVVKIESWPTTFSVNAGGAAYDHASVYTFNQVDKAVADGYNGNVPVTLTWQHTDGSLTTETKNINIKRNVMTTVTVDVASSATNNLVTLTEESGDLTEENVVWHVEAE